MRKSLAALAAPLALAACSSTYHPEYHPVSVNEVSQNLSYPVTVHSVGIAGDRAPLILVPAPPSPVLATPPPPPPPQPVLPPGDWFRGY